MVEVFGKKEEANPIQDHSPDVALHDALATEDYGGVEPMGPRSISWHSCRYMLYANRDPPGHRWCTLQKRE